MSLNLAMRTHHKLTDDFTMLLYANSLDRINSILIILSFLKLGKVVPPQAVESLRYQPGVHHQQKRTAQHKLDHPFVTSQIFLDPLNMHSENKSAQSKHTVDGPACQCSYCMRIEFEGREEDEVKYSHGEVGA